MKQIHAIEKITEVICKDPAIKAIFLKGSIARNVMDDYSDVDYYCLVDEQQKASFLNRRLDYLTAYRPLMFWSASDFVGPQIVGVFDDGLHFDLYTVTEASLHHTDEVKVLYDPEGILSSYVAEPLTIRDEDLINHFHAFTFSLLEFETAYLRGDLLWASRLASHLSGDLALILRYVNDNENAKLGFKRLHGALDDEVKAKLIEALDLSGPSYLPKGPLVLVEILEHAISQLSLKITGQLNMTFFNFMAQKIRSMNAEIS